MKRVLIIGCSGSLKTTLARQVARILNYGIISLDQ